MRGEGIVGNDKLLITPRPPKGEEKFRTFSVRIRDDTVAAIEGISLKTGRTRNELIGTLLDYALKNYVISDEQ